MRFRRTFKTLRRVTLTGLAAGLFASVEEPELTERSRNLEGYKFLRLRHIEGVGFVDGDYGTLTEIPQGALFDL